MQFIHHSDCVFVDHLIQVSFHDPFHGAKQSSSNIKPFGGNAIRCSFIIPKTVDEGFHRCHPVVAHSGDPFPVV